MKRIRDQVQGWHWRTTLAGLALAALNLYANGVTGKQFAISMGLLILGILAADGRAVPTTLPQIPFAPFTPGPIKAQAAAAGAKSSGTAQGDFPPSGP